MGKGISRRQWLLGLLTGFGGSWLARLWPAAPSPAGAVTPPPAVAFPGPTAHYSLGPVTTYVYDAANSRLYLETWGPGLITTVVYESRANGDPLAG